MDTTAHAIAGVVRLIQEGTMAETNRSRGISTGILTQALVTL